MRPINIQLYLRKVTFIGCCYSSLKDSVATLAYNAQSITLTQD